jgi:hypothetical protein
MDSDDQPIEVLGDTNFETSIGFTYQTAPDEWVELDFENGMVGVVASRGDDPGHTSWLSKDQAVEIAKQILGWAGETFEGV